MKLGSISTVTLQNLQRQSILQGQKEIVKASYEATHGHYYDIGLVLGQKSSRFAATESKIIHLKSVFDTNRLALERMATSQNAIKSLIHYENDQSTSGSLINFNRILTGIGSNQPAASTLRTESQTALDNLVAAINTTYNGEYIFGGTNVNEPPFSSYKISSDEGPSAVVHDVFEDYFGFKLEDERAINITKEKMMDFIDGPFSDLFEDPNWEKHFSKASSFPKEASITPDGERATISVSANEEGFRQAFKTIILIGEFCESKLSKEVTEMVIEKGRSDSQASFVGSFPKIIKVAAVLGVMERRVQTSSMVLQSQIDVLTKAQNDLAGVRQEEAVIRLNDLKEMMEASFTLTAQISRLSLIHYL